MVGRNDLASARLVNYARIFVARADGFEEFTYSQDGGSKRMVEKSQHWLSALFSLLPFFLWSVFFGVNLYLL